MQNERQDRNGDKHRHFQTMDGLSRIAVICSCLTFLWIFVKADPCFNHSTFDVTSLGSRNEKCGRPATPGDRLCDYRLKPAWYDLPFDGYILKTCPTSGAGGCGTDFPVWMDDTLPVMSEGIVDRTCCIKRGFNCCAENVTIQVKKCSNKYVYYLPTLQYCDSVYCISTNLTCDQPTTTTTSTTTTTTTTTTATTTTSGNGSGGEDGPSVPLVIGLCIGIGVLVCCLIGGIVYLTYTKQWCKTNSRIDDSEKNAHVYHGNQMNMHPTAPPPYSEVQHMK